MTRKKKKKREEGYGKGKISYMGVIITRWTAISTNEFRPY